MAANILIVEDELRRVAQPLAALAGVDIIFTTSYGSRIALALGRPLRPSARVDDGLDGDSRRRGLERAQREVVYEGLRLGSVAIESEWTRGWAQATVEMLVESALQRLASGAEEEALLEELSASWESLEAVYEISSEMRGLQSPQISLEKIARRAASTQEGLRAVIWLNDESGFGLLGSSEVVVPAPATAGLLTAAGEGRGVIVYNDPGHLARICGLEAEFSRARSLALAPIATNKGRYGELIVWHETAGEVFGSRQTRLLEALALQAAMVIENDFLQREVIETERMRQEIEIGSGIRQTLLVGQPPRGLRGAEIAALAIPSQRIDGDFYDFIEYGDSCFDLIVGDVMGKGIPAALIGAATKNNFLRALNDLQSTADCSSSRPRPEEIVAWVNAEVTEKLIDVESFVTVCYARFDLEQRRLEYIDCGHTKSVHFERRSGLCRMLEGQNMPLGFSSREVFRQQSVPVESGDVFVFYSDGLTEARNGAGEFFGEERLAACIRRHHRLQPKALIERIRREVAEFTDSPIFRDDLTCVVVRIKRGDARRMPAATGSVRMEFASDYGELARVRSLVRSVAQTLMRGGLDDGAIDALELAVNEAFANIIEHAYEERAGESIQVMAEAFPDHLSIELRHVGPPFDPGSIPPPSFDGSRDGGFGLFIIANSVDEVSYARHRDGRNTVTLKKKASAK